MLVESSKLKNTWPESNPGSSLTLIWLLERDPLSLHFRILIYRMGVRLSPLCGLSLRVHKLLWMENSEPHLAHARAPAVSPPSQWDWRVDTRLTANSQNLLLSSSVFSLAFCVSLFLTFIEWTFPQFCVLPSASLEAIILSSHFFLEPQI